MRIFLYLIRFRLTRSLEFIFVETDENLNAVLIHSVITRLVIVRKKVNISSK